jgi:4-oxalocrotonate tautomerase
MPFVTIEMLEGRTVEQKKELVKGLTAAFEKIGVPKTSLHIIIKDNPAHNIANGDKLMSER